ncbi:DUF2235 domain-containing protein [Carboxylicivirga mesophila]|uniref:DUF2235 domain-containing protein n=1 Tax=Carboxylicivirga mesophila TaxID=1166478 RepID=A0ABS5K9X7_9BACT|nr:DUF2235 domain-containing protein [Carboxylicivirga mesophila]MBS2211751.1 DUF2235 domain-containing protein [Carboxylicivirga mesophila]
MKKILFFNFDGTDNEPADAIQDRRLSGKEEDDSITNVLKFHLLLGGQLKEEYGKTQLSNGSYTFYYHGIGTYGNFFQRKFNAGLSKESKDVKTILEDASKNFNDYYSEDIDYIVVTGFSRGAALARRFAAIINSTVNRQIVIEGVFDTVASIGMPNFRKEDRPSSDVVFEHGHTLPSNVLKALHLVSLDDKRKVFQPTLMNKDERVTEIWFPGAHGDVGGGYNYDGLSDNALRFFLDWFEELPELEIRFLSPKNIQYDQVFHSDSGLEIEPDDVQIDPNPLGLNHQQKRLPVISHITLTDRLCCVIKEDKVLKEELPMVHWSVADRIFRDADYKPQSLKGIEHTIWYRDDTTKEFRGTSEHKLMNRSNLKVPSKGGVVTRVYAYLKYNHTGIYLQKGKSYNIEVIEIDKYKWRDGGIHPVDGNGWNRGKVKLAAREIAIAIAEPFKRVTGNGVDWFTLCGCIGHNDDEAFAIGNGLKNYSPKKSGEFCAFANDLNGYYGNNSGFLKVRIEEA